MKASTIADGKDERPFRALPAEIVVAQAIRRVADGLMHQHARHIGSRLVTQLGIVLEQFHRLIRVGPGGELDVVGVVPERGGRMDNADSDLAEKQADQNGSQSQCDGFPPRNVFPSLVRSTAHLNSNTRFDCRWR